MKPIIKETLQKKTTTSAKLRYLAYAYKEWLIAITLFVVFAGSITYSLTRPKEEVVNAEPAAVQAFTTRLAAGAIQMVIFPASDAQLWQERFGSQELPQETITVGENEFILQVTNKEK